MSPLSKRSSPRIAFIRVDFPDPTGPVNIVVVEALSCRSMSKTAGSKVSEGRTVIPVIKIAFFSDFLGKVTRELGPWLSARNS